MLETLYPFYRKWKLELDALFDFAIHHLTTMFTHQVKSAELERNNNAIRHVLTISINDNCNNNINDSLNSMPLHVAATKEIDPEKIITLVKAKSKENRIT